MDFEDFLDLLSQGLYVSLALLLVGGGLILVLVLLYRFLEWLAWLL